MIRFFALGSNEFKTLIFIQYSIPFKKCQFPMVSQPLHAGILSYPMGLQRLDLPLP